MTKHVGSTQDWKPRRKGIRYCAPACGGRCTYAEYKLAKDTSLALAKSLGNGWKSKVYENLGWHWDVFNSDLQLNISKTRSGYFCTLMSQWMGHGKTTASAIADARKNAMPSLKPMKAAVRFLECGLD